MTSQEIRQPTEEELRTLFFGVDGNVAVFMGENYYKACPKMVSEFKGCVKRVNHPSPFCEDWDGNTRTSEPILTVNQEELTQSEYERIYGPVPGSSGNSIYKQPPGSAPESP